MSTPAAAVLDGSANSAGAGAAGAGGAAAGNGASGAGAQSGAANQPFFDSWFKPDAPDAKDTRDWIANKNFADPATLVKSYRAIETEASTLRSAANLKGYPADKVDPTTGAITKADDNQVKAWRATMGVPETADKYDLKPPAGADPRFANYLSQALHEAAVPAAMAPKLAAGYEAAVGKLVAEMVAEENTQSELQLAELKNSWGTNWQERTSLAQRGKEWMSKELGGVTDEQMRTLERTLGTGKFMSMMWKFGAGNKEPGFAGTQGSPGTFGNSASAAQTEIDQITAARGAGQISDLEWRTTKEPRMLELIKIVSAGMAPMQ